MKDNEKLLFKMNVGVDVVACDSFTIGKSSTLTLSDLDSHDAIKILQILDLFDIDSKKAFDRILLRVDHLVSFNTRDYIVECFVHVYYVEEVL